MIKNRVHKFISTLTAAVLMFTAFAFLPYSFDTAQAAEFEKTAQEVVDEITLGYNLGNTLDAHDDATIGSLDSEVAWNAPYTTKRIIDGIRDNGFNIIRVPVTWYNHMDESNVIDEKWMDRVEQVVNYVLDDGMYCIINVHHDTGESGWLRASQSKLNGEKDKFIAIWEQICERFGGYGDKLLFEGYNEILNDSNSWTAPSDSDIAAANTLNQIFVDTVRASGGNNAKRCLLVNSYAASHRTSIIGKMVIPEDTIKNRLIAETHPYVPSDFALKAGTEWSESDIDSALNGLYSRFVANGIPAIVGEFGVCKTSVKPAKSYLEYYRYYITKARELGIRCICWDDACNNTDLSFELYNRTVNEFYSDDLIKVMMAAATGKSYTPTYKDKYVQTGYNMIYDPFKWRASNYDGGFGIISCEGAAEQDVTVNKLGTVPHSVQTIYESFVLEKGKNYQLKFTASCESGTGKIGTIIQKREDPWTAYIDETVEVTTKPTTFTFTTGAMKQTENLEGLCFNYNYVFNTYHVTDISLACLDDIIIIKGDVNTDGYISASDVVLFHKWLLGIEKELPNWQNADVIGDKVLNIFDLCLLKKRLINQSGEKLSDNFILYQDGWDFQAFGGGKGSGKIDSATSQTVTVNAVGEFPYNVQTYYFDLGLSKGKKYKVEFTASCKSGSGQLSVQLQDQKIYTKYFSEIVDVTSVPQKFTFYTDALPKLENETQMDISYGYALNTYNVTDISIREVL